MSVYNIRIGLSMNFVRRNGRETERDSEKGPNILSVLSDSLHKFYVISREIA